jgi:two-component system sensor histidine kinase CreC
MKLGLRIFLCYLVIFGCCLYWPVSRVINALKTQYYQSVEEPLVDQANILAAMIGHDMEGGRFNSKILKAQFRRANDRTFKARIYELVKSNIDTRVYITDKKGAILFDSLDRARPGEDYSSWRDVLLTLKGRYGARTSRDKIYGPDISVIYVAAPIMVNGEIAGVVSVGKPSTNIHKFVAVAKGKIYRVSGLALAAAVLLSLLASWLLTRPVKRLTSWALSIGEGKRKPLPELDSTEIGALGKAFDRMREVLEGRKYAEQYVQTLTHEIKSPLSAIRGAAELLREEMPPEQRQRFLTNIAGEAGRIREVIDRMLELADLESRTSPGKMEKIDLAPLIRTVVESKEPLLQQKQIRLINRIKGGITIFGDPFLVHRAVANLMQNSIDFSKPRGMITIETKTEDKKALIRIQDSGAAIPDYAIDKIYNKFYSLKRPDSDKKSTGLGLNFVRETALLHNGSIHLANRPEGGVTAELRLPL